MLVPVRVRTPIGKDLWPRDPLPINGLKAREVAIRTIRAFAKQVGGTVPGFSSSLPEYLFPETRAGLKYVQAVVQELSGVMYVKLVDKGLGELWGFCRAWVWDTGRHFLETEGYSETAHTDAQVTELMKDVVSGKEWPANSRAQICRLYLTGKAKSLSKGRWRPIAANPQLVVVKQTLWIAARAFTEFLRNLIDEIPLTFQAMRVQGCCHVVCLD